MSVLETHGQISRSVVATTFIVIYSLLSLYNMHDTITFPFVSLHPQACEYDMLVYVFEAYRILIIVR